MTERAFSSIALRHLNAIACLWCALVGFTVALTSPALPQAQEAPPGSAFLSQLRAGGLVIFLRHAPATVMEDNYSWPDFWKTCNSQRRLSATGRSLARELGFIIRGLRIPIGRVAAGELCRARQTAELMELGSVEISADLNDFHTWVLQGRAAGAFVQASQALLDQAPAVGKNTLLVSHFQRHPHIAHPMLELIEMGGAAIFRPRPGGHAELVAVLHHSDWRRLGMEDAPFPR